ncbi:hypothetical protein DPMN_141086 [Dreissena polymorpha]|uniref:Uncharacterized protein n=1 Tax=Dreissena polymorpha TaxID=45954 RepID=A0A9D4G8T4_DREPO|nr:hypothetical protein DPMN_141086 [Dreissena polymorpha]
MDADYATVRQFLEIGCGCKNKCTVNFEIGQVYHHILNMRELTKAEKDIIVMSNLKCGNDLTTKRGKPRKRSMVSYNAFQKPVCKKTFMLVNDIGRSALENLVDHYKQNGPLPRKHGNVGKKPSQAVIYDDVKRVVEFLQNYADTYGIPQPAAPRGSDNTPPIYLDSGKTKLTIHKEYIESCREAGVRSLQRTAFCEIWKSCLCHIRIASPRDDVCATCEGHRKNIMKAIEESEKLEAAENFKQHVINAQKERELYNDCVKRAKETCILSSDKRTNHYTFDFSQNVSIPHFSRRMGPIYFMSLRKVQIFGVRIDGLPKQLNFLIDESETMGIDGTQTHGPNAVISMLDMVLDTHGRGESTCSIHADNCPGIIL